MEEEKPSSNISQYTLASSIDYFLVWTEWIRRMVSRNESRMRFTRWSLGRCLWTWNVSHTYINLERKVGDMKRCNICGRELHPLGYARHMAMHRDEERDRLEQMRKGRSSSMEAHIDE